MKMSSAPCRGEKALAKARPILFVVACSLAAAGALGYRYSQQQAGATANAGGGMASVGAMPRPQRAATDERWQILSPTDAAGAPQGQMQADLPRLRAPGGRPVRIAGLVFKEFPLDTPPPMGGPEPPDRTSAKAAELTEEIDNLFSELQDPGRRLGLLERLILERDLTERSLPAGSPVLSGYISSGFGYRRDPFHRRGRFHKGVDFAGKRGSPIVAVAEGVVILAESRGGYGRSLDIAHGNGLVTRYAHNQKLLVKEGDAVTEGQVIATLGSTGRSTGPHLHFEVLEDGTQVDPMRYVGLNRKGFEGLSRNARLGRLGTKGFARSRTAKAAPRG